MGANFSKIRNFLLELEYTILSEDTNEDIFVIEKHEAGIVNMVIDCEEPLLIFEQFIFDLKNDKIGRAHV